jgi:hypothetical protein
MGKKALLTKVHTMKTTKVQENTATTTMRLTIAWSTVYLLGRLLTCLTVM